MKNIFEKVSSSKYNIELLSNADSNMYYEMIKTRFDLNYQKLFIWDEIKIGSELIPYTTSNWNELALLNFNRLNGDIFLVVSDEEYFPWQIIKGNKKSILEFIKEQPFFEYFIFDQNLEILIFDTHDNFFKIIHKIDQN